MRYVFYIACLALAVYGVSEITGSHYVQQEQEQQMSDNYSSGK